MTHHRPYPQPDESSPYPKIHYICRGKNATIVAVTNDVLQGHSKVVQRFNTNSGVQESEDSSELAA
jgi:hypothetical protein